MGLSVRARGDWVATLRHVSVEIMETLARWVPSSPEYEAKTLFGRHLWDMAQHADALGGRTAELRLGEHANRPPVAAYADVLADVSARPESARRIAGMYDAVIPDLRRRYDEYIASVDQLMDEPTVRIAERAIADLDRLLSERDEVLEARPDLRAEADGDTAGKLAGIDPFVDFRPDPQVGAA